MTFKQLDPEILEKKTFSLHLASQIFNGIAIGIVILSDIILKKSLGGTNFQVMLLSVIISSAFLFSIYGSEIVNRSYNRAKTIIILGIISNIFYIILPLFSNPVYYITCLSLRAIFDSLLLSIWNIAFKHNYTNENRSRYYSYATALQMTLTLIVLTIFGYFLDINYELYKYAFPIAGLFGMITYYNLARMISLSMDDYKGKVNNLKPYFTLNDYKDIILLPGRGLVRTLKCNPAFFRFEAFFFLYGMAFMVLSPVIPVFLVDNLHLAYTPISIAKGLVFQTTLIVFTPLMGKFHGKGSPARFCAFVFATLALYPLTLLSADYVNFNTAIIVYISHFFFGFAMSGISIAWTLSSIYYAPPNEVSNYQAAHITLTGVRGLFSPALGYFVMKIFDIEYAFILSAVFLITGGFLMFRESKTPKIADLRNT